MMLLVLLGLLLALLKYFVIYPVAELSWGWIVTPFVIAFIWFEIVEPMFGLDKKKAHNRMEELRKDRVKKTFDVRNKR